jgi:DNA-binding transcriptional LysR family regulator
MDLRDLAYFQTIAELGHLGRAAEVLHRTKPALTKCIRRLEISLGTRLFRREGRRILLTEVGEVLLRKARQMRALADDAAAEIAKVADGSVGHVRIGTGPTVAEYILPDLFARVMKNHPKLTIEITVGLGNALRAALVDNHLDVIISAILPSDGESFSAYHFATDEVVVVASPHHPLHGRKLAPEDLLAYKWVLPDRSVASRQWIDGVFASRGLRTPEVLVETGSLQLLPILIERTDVLGFTPRSNLLPGHIAAPLVELPLEATTMRRQIGVLCRREPEPSPALTKLLQIVRNTSPSLTQDGTTRGQRSRNTRPSGRRVAGPAR